MNNKRIAVLASVIGVLSLVVQLAPQIFVNRWIGNGPPSWLPTFGTLGQTALVYTNGTEVIGLLFMVVLAVGFGYYVGQRIALRREYQRFLGAVAAGTLIPFVIAYGVTVLYDLFSGGALGVETVFFPLVSLLGLFVPVSLVVTVAAFAGAAFAHIPKSESDLTSSQHAT